MVLLGSGTFQLLSRGSQPSIKHTSDQTEFSDPVVVFAMILWFVGYCGARMCSSEVLEDRLVKFRCPGRRVSTESTLNIMDFQVLR